MKKLIFAIIMIAASLLPNISSAQNEPASDYTVDLARMFGRDIFELNGIPYLKPMVKAVNATSNARFFTTAYIPEEVDKPYFRVGVHGMMGFVRDDMKTFAPQMPNEEFDFEKAQKFVEIKNLNEIIITDTAGLINYLFKTVMHDGLQQGSISVPNSASTVLGNKDTVFTLPSDTLMQLVENHPVYGYLPKDMQDSLTSIVREFPETYPLYAGGDISTILAAVPQVEIGSWYGTELLVRVIPLVDLGKYIGEFAFWGFGLRHSISQYFPERWFDMAVQAVYQGTYLKNFVGTTNAELRANANFWNINLQASKSIDGWFDIYSGLSVDFVNISSSFKYYLPGEIQYELGLIEDPADPRPTPGYPGDTEPQVSHIALHDTNLKWAIGIKKEIGPVAIFADFSVSQFDVFSGGIQYTF